MLFDLFLLFCFSSFSLFALISFSKRRVSWYCCWSLFTLSICSLYTSTIFYIPRRPDSLEKSFLLQLSSLQAHFFCTFFFCQLLNDLQTFLVQDTSDALPLISPPGTANSGVVCGLCGWSLSLPCVSLNYMLPGLIYLFSNLVRIQKTGKQFEFCCFPVFL